MAKRKKSKVKRSSQARRAGKKRRAKGAAPTQAVLPEQSQLFADPSPAAAAPSSLAPAPALPERKKGPTRGGRPTTSTHELLAEVPAPRRAVAAPRAKVPGPRPVAKATTRPAPDAPLSMAQIYETLAALLVPYARRMESEMHPKIGFCLKAKNARTGRETHFGAVQALPDGVAYHLFPLYGHPDLLSGVSPELANKLRGQTCFHFDTLHAGLVAELAQLTNAGFERFLTDGVF